MKLKHRYVVLAICSSVFALFHAARQILPPALPLIKDQLDLSYAQAGLVSSSYDVGYTLTLILGGYAAYKFARVRLIFGGLLLLSISLMLTYFTNDYYSLLAARVLSGAAFGAYFAAGVSIISSYFTREERGMALGLHTGVGAGSGKLLAPLVAGLLLVPLGWQPLFIVVGIPALLAAIAFRAVVKEPVGESLETPTAGAIVREVFCNRFLVILGVSNAFLVGGTVTLYSFLPFYLVNEIGADLSYGGYAVAFLNAVSIPVVPIIGALSDRFGRKAVILSLSVLSAGTLFVFPFFVGPLQIVLGILLLGLCVGTSFPVVVSYTIDVAPPRHRTMALGYINTYSVLGGAAATILAGYVSDFYGVSVVFPFLAALSTLAAMLQLRLSEPLPARIKGEQSG